MHTANYGEQKVPWRKVNHAHKLLNHKHTLLNHAHGLLTREHGLRNQGYKVCSALTAQMATKSVFSLLTVRLLYTLHIHKHC